MKHAPIDSSKEMGGRVTALVYPQESWVSVSLLYTQCGERTIRIQQVKCQTQRGSVTDGLITGNSICSHSKLL